MKVFETPLNDISAEKNVVKFTHLISKEAKNNKCYVKYVF